MSFPMERATRSGAEAAGSQQETEAFSLTNPGDLVLLTTQDGWKPLPRLVSGQGYSLATRLSEAQERSQKPD